MFLCVCVCVYLYVGVHVCVCVMDKCVTDGFCSHSVEELCAKSWRMFEV